MKRSTPVTNFFKHTSRIFLIVIVCRLFGVLTCGDFSGSWQRIKTGNSKDQVRLIFSVNNDEMLIGEVAINHRCGLGYSSSMENHRAGYIYDFTAFRPSYPVYLHIFLQKLYVRIFPGEIIEWKKTDPYFMSYAAVMQLMAFILFIVSLFYFKEITLYFFDDIRSNIALLLYGLHPAVIIYIGNLVNYESITTSLLIIIVALILKSRKEQLNVKEISIMLVSFLFSILFRQQLLFIFLFLFLAYLLITFLNRKQFMQGFKQSFKLISACLLLFILFNIPVLIKNHRLFGGWTLGTTGYSFSLGHNPYARGGWCGDCFINTGSPYYKYIREQIQGYDKMNEYEKVVNLQRVAVKWIISNPVEEGILVARKVAIYFLPYNNDHEVFNPFNFIYHLGTILFTLMFLIEIIANRKLNQLYLIIFSPLAGSLFLSVFFHVGYRWRYYAEPFMVMMTLIVLESFRKKYFSKKNKAQAIDNVT